MPVALYPALSVDAIATLDERAASKATYGPRRSPWDPLRSHSPAVIACTSWPTTGANEVYRSSQEHGATWSAPSTSARPSNYPCSYGGTTPSARQFDMITPLRHGRHLVQPLDFRKYTNTRRVLCDSRFASLNLDRKSARATSWRSANYVHVLRPLPTQPTLRNRRLCYFRSNNGGVNWGIPGIKLFAEPTQRPGCWRMGPRHVSSVQKVFTHSYGGRSPYMRSHP